MNEGSEEEKEGKTGLEFSIECGLTVAAPVSHAPSMCTNKNQMQFQFPNSNLRSRTWSQG